MKLLIAVKRVIDPYVKIRVKTDQTGVETQNVKMSMNPFDEIAVEAALRFRDEGREVEIILVTVGSEASQETLRYGLALGADRAVLVSTDRSLCSLNVAHVLRAIVNKEQPDIVLMGKQSIDGDNNQTPQMLAELLQWPQATYASAIAYQNHALEVTREVDGGLETIQIDLPAVVSTDLRLNTPRYVSLPNIMKARQKPMETIPLETLPLHLKDHIQRLSVKPPAARKAGVRVHDVAELVEQLQLSGALSV